MVKAKTVLILILIVLGVSVVGAQETPGFVSDLAQLMTRYGLTDEKINAFRAGASELDWTAAADIDPLTLTFVFEYGLTMENGPVDEPLVFAHAIAHQIARMTQFGLDNRQIGLACTEATREVVHSMQQEQTQSMGENGTALGEMLRTRLMSAGEGQMLRIASRVRNSTPSGDIHRIGETEPGVPPERPENPGSGTGSGPNK